MYAVRMNILKQKATWAESGTETKLLESVSYIYSKRDEMEAPIQISVSPSACGVGTLVICYKLWGSQMNGDQLYFELRASKQPLLWKKKFKWC